MYDTPNNKIVALYWLKRCIIVRFIVSARNFFSFALFCDSAISVGFVHFAVRSRRTWRVGEHFLREVPRQRSNYSCVSHGQGWDFRRYVNLEMTVATCFLQTWALVSLFLCLHKFHSGETFHDESLQHSYAKEGVSSVNTHIEWYSVQRVRQLIECDSYVLSGRFIGFLRCF